MKNLFKRYIVTKGNRTLFTGDHFYIDNEGCLLCCEVGGWLLPDDTEKILKQIEFKTDNSRKRVQRIRFEYEKKFDR